MTSASGGSDQDTRAQDGAERVEPALARREVVREHDDHQDLGELTELEREWAEADPARGPADAVADRQGEDEQTELEAVDRPRHGPQPAVIERRREHVRDRPR